MKTLPPALQTHLDTGATTMCWCLRVDRLDTVTFGFTDHDRDLTFDTVTYLASTGFSASQAAKELGFNVDNLSVLGVISSAGITEDDIAAGFWDGATIQIFSVNWADVAQRVLLHKGPIGEISRATTGFKADLVGQSFYLNQPAGRVHSYLCDVELGSPKCGIDLEAGINNGTGTVSSISSDQHRIVASGLGAFIDDWFSNGSIEWLTGDNVGTARVKVKRHVVTATQVRLETWFKTPKPIQAGDTFAVRAGCDFTFETCNGKFANKVNFRGFPHLIGNDAVAANPSDQDNLDGGSRYGA